MCEIATIESGRYRAWVGVIYPGTHLVETDARDRIDIGGLQHGLDRPVEPEILRVHVLPDQRVRLAALCMSTSDLHAIGLAVGRRDCWRTIGNVEALRRGAGSDGVARQLDHGVFLIFLPSLETLIEDGSKAAVPAQQHTPLLNAIDRPSILQQGADEILLATDKKIGLGSAPNGFDGD